MYLPVVVDSEELLNSSCGGSRSTRAHDERARHVLVDVAAEWIDARSRGGRELRRSRHWRCRRCRTCRWSRSPCGPIHRRFAPIPSSPGATVSVPGAKAKFLMTIVDPATSVERAAVGGGSAGTRRGAGRERRGQGQRDGQREQAAADPVGALSVGSEIVCRGHQGGIRRPRSVGLRTWKVLETSVKITSKAAHRSVVGVMIEVNTASDAALVVAIGRYHEPALAEAYRRHGGAVRALALRVLRSEPLADEVTQDVFLRLWRQPERFDAVEGGAAHLPHFHRPQPGRRPTPLRVRSHQTRRAQCTRDGHHRLRRRAPCLGPRRRRTGAERARRAFRATSATPSGSRTSRAVPTARWRPILGQPEGTVKSRIRAGLKRMRAALAHHQAEPMWTKP